jgi:hypothetical protein
VEESKPEEVKPLRIGLLFNPRRARQHTHTAEEVRASIAGLQAYLKENSSPSKMDRTFYKGKEHEEDGRLMDSTSFSTQATSNLSLYRKPSAVNQKRQQLEQQRRSQLSLSLQKQNEYREEKLALVKRYLDVVKSQKRLKTVLAQVKLEQIVRKIGNRITTRKEQMKKNMTCIRIALQMQTNFARVIRRTYGASFEFRETNRHRFSITAQAQMTVRLQE